MSKLFRIRIATPVMDMICSDNSKYYFLFSVMGKAFKKEAKSVTDLLANLSLEDISKFESELESQGEFQLNDSVKITKDMVQVKRQTKQVLLLNIFDWFFVCITIFNFFNRFMLRSLRPVWLNPRLVLDALCTQFLSIISQCVRKMNKGHFWRFHRP